MNNKDRMAALTAEMDRMQNTLELEDRLAFNPEEQATYSRLKSEYEALASQSQGRKIPPGCEKPLGSNPGFYANAATTSNATTYSPSSTSTGSTFSGVGEMCAALYAGAKGHPWDSRLIDAQHTARSWAASMGTTSGSGGGFAVPVTFVAQALEPSVNDTPLLSNCVRIPMDTGKTLVPSFSDDDHNSTAPYGITWSQISEGGSFGTAQALAMRQLNIEAKKSGAYFSVNNEWLEDANPTLIQQIDSIFTQSLRWYIEKLLWTGTGAGQALGALNASATLQIDAEGGQAADTLITENVVKMWARLRPGSHSRAFWSCNPTCLPELMTLTVTAGTGGSLVGLVQPSSIAGAPPLSILGRPLYLNEHQPALGDAGDIALVDPNLYYMGEARQVSVDISKDVLFSTDQTAFRVSARFDAQPAMSGVLTPANGDTLAWAVTVAAR